MNSRYLYLIAADSDTFSLNSQHLKHNPLLSPRKSDEDSVSTLTFEEREFSATESLQDLRLISLLPTGTMGNFAM